MSNSSPLAETLFVSLQHMLPTHMLSRLAHRVTRVRTPWFKNALIDLFCRRYRIDLGEAQIRDPHAYHSFNDFFTRELTPGARPLPTEATAAACPVDGAVSQVGVLDGSRLIQAKGRVYDAGELLASRSDGATFNDGAFVTLYLAPRNYHRVHMPLDGTLTRTRLVPGRLFSVNPATARRVPRLFARNERLVCLFDTAVGPMAVVLVGAMLVGSIETVWGGEATPPRARGMIERSYEPNAVRLKRGAELGRFNMGSSVIVLFASAAVTWDSALEAGAAVRMGQRLAHSA